ncbi:MAG TPA: hypothetical protein VEK08_17670 [Planctomycetota bacterium]|nr:hypothetical protein [Planctomycetota bacterium]
MPALSFTNGERPDALEWCKRHGQLNLTADLYVTTNDGTTELGMTLKAGPNLLKIPLTIYNARPEVETFQLYTELMQQYVTDIKVELAPVATNTTGPRPSTRMIVAAPPQPTLPTQPVIKARNKDELFNELFGKLRGHKLDEVPRILNVQITFVPAGGAWQKFAYGKYTVKVLAKDGKITILGIE